MILLYRERMKVVLGETSDYGLVIQLVLIHVFWISDQIDNLTESPAEYLTNCLN